MAKKKYTVEEVTDLLFDMGTTLNEKFETTEDIKVAQQAIAAFNVGIKAYQTQVTYKKLTGTPTKITFLE